jgi:hypothetical protein
MTKTKPIDPAAEELAALEQLARAKRARLRAGRQEVPDPWRPLPRRPVAEPKPATPRLADMLATERARADDEQDDQRADVAIAAPQPANSDPPATYLPAGAQQPSLAMQIAFASEPIEDGGHE